MENVVENFLKVSLDSNYGYSSGHGSGSGSDSGSGYGYGSGHGYGDGYGDGDGSGYGDGDGYGSGSGNRWSSGSGYSNGDGSGSGNRWSEGCVDIVRHGDIKTFNRQPVYIIDGLPIILTAMHNNIANGYMIKEDLTLKHCYIAKVGGYFAHGYSVRQALSEAQSKYQRRKPIEERLADFNATFPYRNKKIPAKELYKWHNILTGSCEFGRREFCKDHEIDIDKDLLTVNEFIALTVNEYGGNIIKQL